MDAEVQVAAHNAQPDGGAAARTDEVARRDADLDRGGEAEIEGEAKIERDLAEAQIDVQPELDRDLHQDLDPLRGIERRIVPWPVEGDHPDIAGAIGYLRDRRQPRAE